jgi:hypothetical protein
MSVRRALPLIGADLSRRTAGRPGVSRSEGIRGMPSSVSGESRRRFRGSARLRLRADAGARPTRASSGRPQPSECFPACRELRVARYPTPGLRSRATTVGRCQATDARRCEDPAACRCETTDVCRCEGPSAGRCKTADVRPCDAPLNARSPRSRATSSSCAARRSRLATAS